MPTLFEIYGLRFYFYADEHLPIHVHIQNGDGTAKIDIESMQVIENRGIKPKDIKKALVITEMYRSNIINSWEEFFND